MRNPIHVLKSLEEKASVSNYKYERLYRNLYNPEFYLLAYANIAKSQGSMTQGVDGQTLDNMSLPRINRIIESIRNRTYQPKPAKRKYIPFCFASVCSRPAAYRKPYLPHIDRQEEYQPSKKHKRKPTTSFTPTRRGDMSANGQGRRNITIPP